YITLPLLLSFYHPPSTWVYPLSLHDALPILLGSALCMDKLKAKDVLAAHGIPQVPWIGLRDTELDQAAARVTDAGLRYPVFVKPDRKSTRLNSSHVKISYAVFCLKKKKNDR